ncbi:MAG TPA: hypothetical protein VGH32_09105 [Pirellulales bacterium]
MSFKLARHFAERAAEPAPPAADSTAPFAAGAVNPTAFGAAAAGIAFSELPGFAHAPIPAASDAPDESAAEQLRIQRDTYALMSGAGINVVVKNSDQQSRFS